MTYNNLIVTGGCGFIGSNLVDKLVEGGHFVTVIDDLSAGTNCQYLQQYIEDGSVEFYKFDIRNFDDLNKIDRDYDAIFHLAAQPDVKISVNKPIFDFDINVRGSVNILELMRLKEIPKIIFASSGGTIYGETYKKNNENQALQPISNYGAAKAAVEMYCRSYSSLYGISSVSLRLGNIFGPRSTHGVMFDFYNKLIENPHELLILGDGNQMKTYLYISDTIEAFTLLYKHINNGFDAYNVSSNEVISVKEIADEIVKDLGLDDVKYTYTGTKRGWKGDVIHSSVDTTKIRSLGWKNEIPIKKGIELYMNWLNNNQSRKLN